MNILVTGGAGYIGSHTCVALIESGHSVIIADDLSNSNIGSIEAVEKLTGKKVGFYPIDVTDLHTLNEVFVEHTIDGVIHFAGFKAVGESVEKPFDYYRNNLISTMNVVNCCLEHGVNRFIFSSSATVYGDHTAPLHEDLTLKPRTNPYGETKAMSERILEDVSKANPAFGVTLLRYFNPIGAHESGLIGEVPNGVPNNLVPFVTQVAKGKREKLFVFGNDYDTQDGTAVRDYVHVMDLAEGHVSALEKLEAGVHIYNLGTGKGSGVFDIVNTFEEANGVKVPLEVIERRAGDLPESYADVSKAKRELSWEAKRDLETMCRDAWNFEKNYKG